MSAHQYWSLISQLNIGRR